MYCNQCLKEQSELKDKEIKCGSEKCDNFVYLNPKLAALGIVFKSNTILLVKRNIEPHYDKWSLPAGYINFGESPENAIVREVYEETNIKIKVKSLIGSNFNEKSKVIILCYKAEYVSGKIEIGEECKDVRFFDLNKLPKLPFKNDDQLIKSSMSI